jgi:hypothetical protein
MPFDANDYIPELPAGIEAFADAAASGTDQATATALRALNSTVRHVPPGGGVRLVRALSFVQRIINATPALLRVYPLDGQSIWPNTTPDAPLILRPAHVGLFVVHAGGLCYRMFSKPLVAPKAEMAGLVATAFRLR